MPTISQARISSRTGDILFSSAAVPTGNNASTPAAEPDSFAIETPTNGVKLYDSVNPNGGNHVLHLRNLVGTGGVTVTESNGVITVAGIVPGTGGSNTLIAAKNVLANPRDVAGRAVGTPLSDLIDQAIGDQFGALLYRGSSGWGLLSPGNAGEVLQMGVEPGWRPQYLPLMASISGAPSASQQVWTIPVVSPFTIPTDCTGSLAVADAATSTAIFVLSYIRSDVLTTIGTITWLADASSGTFSSTLYDAEVGDVLLLTAPEVVDDTLANIGIVVQATI